MKLNIKAVAIAEAIICGLLFILCRLAFAVAPETTLAALRYFTHIDWSSVVAPINWVGFFVGLIVFTVFMAVTGAVWAWVYNRVASAPLAPSA
jgi:hypothetical protein